jgi:hypothetical protein
MNDNDRDNLNFLLTVSQEVFEDWFDQADQDDVDYALELLAMRKTELNLKELEFADDVEDTTQANQVLRKFML